MSSNPVTVPRKGVGPDTFLRACGQFTTGVAITTVLDASGTPHGMTVNSFTSVSLEPPLVLVCIDRKTRIIEHFAQSDFFAINILRDNQQELSMRFARPVDNRFDAVEWYAGESGMPLIAGSLAMIECAVERRIDAGDHVILIGEVIGAVRHEGRPLLYYGSSYRRIDEDTYLGTDE